MATQEEVRKFLLDFHAKRKVYDILFRDERKKNSTALLDLEITYFKRKEIIEILCLEDYSTGPEDDTLYGIASMWIFGRVYKKRELYIKISLGITGSNVICISFHEASSALKYPLKK